MSWAARRRLIILSILGAVAFAFLLTIGIATFYQAPSCADTKQNQGETGIDCGGPCAYLCTEAEQPPTVLFTKEIKNGTDRTDVVAEVENKNADAAARGVPYTITLYGSDQTIIQQMSGSFDLPPAGRIPIFIPGIGSGKQLVARAFLDIPSLSVKWFSLPVDPRVVPTVSNTKQTGTVTTPRIEAVLTNPDVHALLNVRVIVLVRDNRGDVIAASSTVLPNIPPQSSVTATFTWVEAFSGVPASIEVVPIIPFT